MSSDSFRRSSILDIFEVDPSEGRGDGLYGLYETVYIGRIDFDIEGIDISKRLEEHTLAFHDRFAGHGADVAESQDGRAVRNDSDQIPFAGILVDIDRVLFDLQAGGGNAR